MATKNEVSTNIESKLIYTCEYYDFQSTVKPIWLESFLLIWTFCTCKCLLFLKSSCMDTLMDQLTSR